MFNKYWLHKLIVITNEFSTFSSSNYKEKYKEWMYSVCHGNYPFKEVNDTNDFQARF